MSQAPARSPVRGPDLFSIAGAIRPNAPFGGCNHLGPLSDLTVRIEEYKTPLPDETAEAQV